MIMSSSHKAIKRQENSKSFLCLRQYYKWILCFSLTLYFLTSFFVGHDREDDEPAVPSSTGSTRLLSNPKPSFLASRAMIESENDNNRGVLHQKLNPRTETFNNLKVYVYDLPSKFNTDWLTNDRCTNHLFAAEVAVHRALLSLDDNGGIRTSNPYEADFFFVPVYVSCNFSTTNGFPAIGHARSLISAAVRLISIQYPFWNMTRGSDHVFVATHDFGACFHTMEDRAIADGVLKILRNSIILQTFGVKYKHPCQEVENVVIPPYVSPESLQKTLKNSPVTGERDIWVFFRGKMEVHPKNISGRFYSKRVRTEIWRRYGGDRRFYLQRHRFAGYQSEIARSVFCLCPLGWAPWSPRLVESVVLGCVPVIIADGIRLPFETAVRWPEISLTVAERDVAKLDKILEHVAATNLSIIQRNLNNPSVKRALLFNVHMRDGDATWQVLEALSTKLNRSVRMLRHVSQ